jgi:hypothetical protein
MVELPSLSIILTPREWDIVLGILEKVDQFRDDIAKIDRKKLNNYRLAAFHIQTGRSAGTGRSLFPSDPVGNRSDETERVEARIDAIASVCPKFGVPHVLSLFVPNQRPTFETRQLLSFIPDFSVESFRTTASQIAHYRTEREKVRYNEAIARNVFVQQIDAFMSILDRYTRRLNLRVPPDPSVPSRPVPLISTCPANVRAYRGDFIRLLRRDIPQTDNYPVLFQAADSLTSKFALLDESPMMEKLAIISEIIAALEILTEGGKYALDLFCDLLAKSSCYQFFDMYVALLMFERQVPSEFGAFDTTILMRWKSLRSHLNRLVNAKGSPDMKSCINQAIKAPREAP